MERSLVQFREWAFFALIEVSDILIFSTAHSLGRVVEFDDLDCSDGLIKLVMQLHNSMSVQAVNESGR